MTVYRVNEKYTNGGYKKLMVETEAEYDDYDHYWHVLENNDYFDESESYPREYFSRTKEGAKKEFYRTSRKAINRFLSSIERINREMKEVKTL
jgi:hypothetical protein